MDTFYLKSVIGVRLLKNYVLSLLNFILMYFWKTDLSVSVPNMFLIKIFFGIYNNFSYTILVSVLIFSYTKLPKIERYEENVLTYI